MRWAAFLLALAFGFSGLALAAEPVDHQAIAERAAAVIIPAAETFAAATAALAGAAPGDCAATDGEAVRARFNAAWDAWTALQPYRFGPLEDQSRALQIAFWPDPRGMTGRTVERLLATEAAPVDDPAAFAQASVAGRGLPALERLLYDENGPVVLDDAFRCAYVAAAARDLARLAGESAALWRDPWAGRMTEAGAPRNEVFLAPREVTARLYSSLIATLDETATQRLAPPLGTFDAPKPRLAEAWRSGRSLAQVAGLIDATETELTRVFFPALDDEARASIASALDTVHDSIGRVVEGGGIPEAVAGPERIRVEVLMQSIERLVVQLREHLGPGVGVAEGFNAADGD
jgi:predicted lipoprotein